MDLGRYLQRARGDRSQREGADAIGTAEPTISGWELRRTIPRRSKLPTIALVYGVPLARLRALWAQAERDTTAVRPRRHAAGQR